MKETYYFQHDYNSTNDPKIVCLLGVYGAQGYGIFWRIIEMLHQEENHKLPRKAYIYEAVASQMVAKIANVEKLVNDCIAKFELFSGDDNFFWSERVLRQVGERDKKYLEIKEMRSKAGKKGNAVRWAKSQTVAEGSQNIANVAKGKERKVNILYSENKKSHPVATNDGVRVCHDGTLARMYFGQWVDANDKSVSIDLSRYPELTK